MRLAGFEASVLVTDDGEQILKLVGVTLAVSNLLPVIIDESEDLGLWIRLPRKNGIHLFLLLWQYIFGIEVPSGPAKIVGLRG